jgi:glycosyltransferase involved in cell wall biosynthesis
MSTAPAISVIMSVYNGGRFLSQAVESILAQTFSDFEFIIIDDGSTDDSRAVLQQFAQKDQRIKLTSRENRGLTKSLNEGIAMAQGEFLARMDSDDVSLPERFALQIEFLRAHPDCVAVGGDSVRIDEDGREMTGPKMPVSHDEIEAELLLGKGGALMHPTLMVRKEAMNAVGGYRELFKTSQDLDLYLRLAQKGKLANIPQVVLRYRIHDASVSSAKREQQDCDVAGILRQAYSARGMTLPRHVERRRFEITIENYTKDTWAALRAKDSTAARSSAMKVIRKAPLRLDSWLLLWHALTHVGKQKIRRKLRQSET